MGTGGGDGRATGLCPRPTVSKKYHPGSRPVSKLRIAVSFMLACVNRPHA